MKTSITNIPSNKCFGGVTFWERSLDPWHPEAFQSISDSKKWFSISQKKQRKEGWMAHDACGNPIGWVPDNTAMEDHSEEYIIAKSPYNKLTVISNNENLKKHYIELHKNVKVSKNG